MSKYQKAKLLVIEDDFQLRVLLRELLNDAGYTVYEASEGAEGIELYKRHNPDLVLTDLVMPDKEGIETIKELIQDYPEVKIIAMSGANRGRKDAYLSVAKLLGATACFAKPFNNQELVNTVQHLVGECS
jgi:CheY-like chemotaxis protein